MWQFYYFLLPLYANKANQKIFNTKNENETSYVLGSHIDAIHDFS